MNTCHTVRGTTDCTPVTLRNMLLGLALCGLASCSIGKYEPSHAAAPVKHADDIESDLRRTVHHLAGSIGERNAFHPEKLSAAKEWISGQLRSRGLTNVKLLGYPIDGTKFECADQTVFNIEAEVRGTKRPEEIVVIGAHYDTKVHTPHWKQHDHPLPALPGTPGANDNASGVAAVLSLAKYFSAHPQERTLRFVAFTNEEAPFYQKEDAMGSLVYARQCSKRAGERIVLMISAETLGCYSQMTGDEHKKRKHFEPISTWLGLVDRPDYVAFTGNMRSNKLMRKCAEAFRRDSSMDVRTLALREINKGIAWSDDWSFWQTDVPAFSVTDTAYNRSDSYHDIRDKPETLDYGPFASVVRSMRGMLSAAASSAF